MPNEINVKFRVSQRGYGEDVYYSEERKRCYIRQESSITDPPAVSWLTCTKGSDGCGWVGYEACSPIREGITMKAVGPDGVYFEEKLESMRPWRSSAMAPKVGKFSWEIDREERKK